MAGSTGSFSESSSYSEGTRGVASEPVTSRVYSDYHREVADLRSASKSATHAPRTVQRNVEDLTDPSFIRSTVVKPSALATKAILVLVDKSGSNEVIETHLRNSSGHFAAFHRLIDDRAEVAWGYVSDHRDGERWLQCVDFVSGSEVGDKIAFNTLRAMRSANGYDTPEALECALWWATHDVDFGHVKMEDRILIVVSDSIPHGMTGFLKAFPRQSDYGCEGYPFAKPEDCPNGGRQIISWQDAVRAARKTFGRFVFIGSGCEPKMTALQQEMMGLDNPPNAELDFIDLSTIEDDNHRNGIVGNAILFAMAREAGIQVVPSFLAGLYKKWLANPVFGDKSDDMAKHRIRSFGKYLSNIMSPEETERMMRRVLAEESVG